MRTVGTVAIETGTTTWRSFSPQDFHVATQTGYFAFQLGEPAVEFADGTGTRRKPAPFPCSAWRALETIAARALWSRRPARWTIPTKRRTTVVPLASFRVASAFFGMSLTAFSIASRARLALIASATRPPMLRSPAGIAGSPLASLGVLPVPISARPLSSAFVAPALVAAIFLFALVVVSVTFTLCGRSPLAAVILVRGATHRAAGHDRGE